MVISFKNSHSEEIFGKSLMASGNCTFLAQPKYKQCKFSAIRDFPAGCGPFASRIDPLPKVDIAGFGSTNGTVVEDKDGKHLRGHTELEDIEFTRSAKAVKCDFSNMSSKLSSPAHEVVFSGVSKFSPSDANIAGSSACLEKAVTRRYFPQIRVSAVRDFPPLCGQNALLLGKDECLKGISSIENKSMGLQSMAVGEKPLKKPIATDAKEVEKNSFARLDRSKAASKTKYSPNHSLKKPLKWKNGNAAPGGMGKLVIREKKDSFDPNKNIKEFQVVQKSDGFNVNVPPFGCQNFGGVDNDSNVTRNKVRETLRLFQAVSRKLLQEEESKSTEQANTCRRTDLQAARILKEKGKHVNKGKQILGSVPGVEVGDEFQYRIELNIIGLHRPIQGGIDYVKHNGKILATSIVASGGYDDELDDSDVLIFSGQGGNVMNTDKEPEDQKLKRGNLSLKNSSEEKNPVRVIRGSESMDGKHKTYVYDGLYVVETSWQDMGPHGKLVFRFQLRRIPGQPELAWKEVKKSKKFKTREGLCVEDISHGKELIPICAVNTIDDEKPPPFEYVTSMTYPGWCNRIPPKGCDCTNACSDPEKCSCAVKNGGEIPFNHNGAIVKAKPLVYECGPSCNCKCTSTCYNRVSQHGIKFQLENFKTKTRGWGVRSLNSNPSGSFICEYIGELLEEKEAEKRIGNDEYLFDIGNNYNNNTLWDGLSTLTPDAQSISCVVVEDGGFAIDAAQYGNVGRFINHSCSPNLYAQNVLYDHDDKRIPHIMFFAAENIPPLQELTYDYNYKIDQVYNSDGNIKRKNCYCGSV